MNHPRDVSLPIKQLIKEKIMKINKTCIIVGISVLAANRCMYAMDTVTNEYPSAVTSPLYSSQEVSVDMFGMCSVGEQTIDHLSGNRLRDNGRLGVGGGLNYFFCRYVGVGGEAYSENPEHSFIDSTSGNLIGRLPIGETGLAPYVFGGGGYEFDNVEQKFAQAGGGLEFRFTKNIGIFTDARYVFADKTENYGVGRAGLRISF
jgi:hypothetical protein